MTVQTPATDHTAADIAVVRETPDQYRPRFRHQIVRKGDRYAYVCLDTEGHQYSAPAYGSPDGGDWVAASTDAGCDYVADWSARSTAYRRFAAAVRPEEY
jgi:hypothetical protein